MKAQNVNEKKKLEKKISQLKKESRGLNMMQVVLINVNLFKTEINVS